MTSMVVRQCVRLKAINGRCGDYRHSGESVRARLPDADPDGAPAHPGAAAFLPRDAASDAGRFVPGPPVDMPKSLPGTLKSAENTMRCPDNGRPHDGGGTNLKGGGWVGKEFCGLRASARQSCWDQDDRNHERGQRDGSPAPM